MAVEQSVLTDGGHDLVLNMWKPEVMGMSRNSRAFSHGSDETGECTV